VSIQDIGAIGELISAIAVVFSLLYLSLQIRNQNRESQAAATHEISQAFRDSINGFASIDKADIYVRGNEDWDGLSTSEKFVLIATGQQILRVWEEAYHQHNERRLPDTIWNVMHSQYSNIVSAQSFGRIWDLRKQFFDPAFREYVDNIEREEYTIK
jgi:hypothetical protein